MAHSNQAKKRVRQNEKARMQNKAKKSVLRTYIKKTTQAVEDRDLGSARKLLSQTMKRLDKAAKTHTIHKNTANRQKSRLARKVAGLGAGTPEKPAGPES
jgi:small subunit ribosomal protein S20